MKPLSTTQQVAIGTLLALLLWLTRGAHFPTITQALPGASWAVFFLAGVYLRPLWVPVALFGLASLLDFAAIRWQGISSYCMSPAYLALIPAYAALWFGGRWCASAPRKPWVIGTAAVVSTVVCELVSSGSFYLWSGRFAAPSIGEFLAREATYLPAALGGTLFWLTLAAIVHALTAFPRLKARGLSDRM